MRPVLLEMTGFASFREKTEVSFAETDYFALVGSTGAGKSTVFDAITFALYGSVARWDHEGMVAPALAPTTNRGTIRLVFDAAGARYQVVREIRRSGGKNASVSIKNSRLERFENPGATGDLEDVTSQMAADSEVNSAVVKLLGLTFKHFCTCVALPQGDFAEFLHAKPSDRQKILIKLLGFEVYERIARRASEIAAQQSNRAGTLAEQLDDYKNVTEEGVEQLASRMAALGALRSRVDAALPGLDEAADKHRELQKLVDLLRMETALLEELEQPRGVEELEAKRRASAKALEVADTAVAAAETADDSARTALGEGPARHELERVRRYRAELSSVEGALPNFLRDAETASAAKVLLDARLVEVGSSTAGMRDASGIATRAAEDARARADLGQQQCDRLSSLQQPEGLADLTAAAAGIAKRTADAAARLIDAESVDVKARAAMAAQPDSAVLAGAQAEARELRDLCEAQRTALAGYAARRAQLDDAQAALAALAEGLEAARETVAAMERADQAMALRAHLVVGEPCPVCEQDVRRLPSHDGHVHLTEMRDRLELIEQQHRQAEAAVQAAQRAADRDADQHAVAIGRAESCRRALARRPGAPEPALLSRSIEITHSEKDLADLATTASEVVYHFDTALDTRSRLALAEHAAADELVAAREARDDVTQDAERAEKLKITAKDGLRAARDPLVELGAPPADTDDLAAGWNHLVAWAAVELGERRVVQKDLEAQAEATASKASDVASHLLAAETVLERTRTEAGEATLAEHAAATKAAMTTERRDELLGKLTDAPSVETVEAQLVLITELEQAAKQSAADLKAARTKAHQASEADKAMRKQTDLGRQLLSRARDALVSMGAPPLDDGDLLDAWTTLTGWAAEQAAERGQRLTIAAADETMAAEALRETEHKLVEDVRSLDVPLDGLASGEKPARDVVPVAVATGIARAERDHAEMRTRVAAAEHLRAQIEVAEGEAQVAKLLAYNLRSDKFQRWMLASALDVLVVEASAVLRELSGGQFELTHDDGDFLVVDHNEADSLRRVKTLSGGETFQASLALALALSSQLGSMAAEGAARLESIFLDEGFGTLDEATLDVVASTLENLAATGNRMVGVVTHVAALAERVPVRFRVSRDGAGSHVTREAI